MAENRCISCGEIIPEGRMVCWSCENQSSTINWKVHAAHCCKWHGCKYGDYNCPVELGLVKQEYLCEYCEEAIENEQHWINVLKNIQEMKEFKSEKSNSSN